MITGAAPAGADGPDQAARWVWGMFARIAPRYDLLNRLLSFGQDSRWRRSAAVRVRRWIETPGARALDLCCGTGELLAALWHLRRPAGPRNLLLAGCDFCRPMLLLARRKLPAAALIEADALRLPVADGSLDLVTVAFGFRNLADYRGGLAEMRRVLRPGGAAAILEFSRPTGPLLGPLYAWYARSVLPRLGGWISGHPDAYRYLPESVSKFPTPPELAEWMREAGFAQVRFELFSGGIVALHLGIV
ncbi:MAG: ubiquinone/menaquinone biosynthesis methyltransferase [Bryobacterales bacterium]|nr:ubiquinone/menaquinone biosynthesis methyltransferase [Bryobacteraceae bacterium]MDW8130701.1 ubiquinone/menaquinone biosynthesis methyltransferase [Bryobacterales bacterium]